MKPNYSKLIQEIETFMDSGISRDEILLNACILLKNEVFHYDWVGFYLLDTDKTVLILGPYCGKQTEHTRIPVGQGVCGQVAESLKLKIVQDVTKEGNYIACSLDVQSEIVVPILKNGQFIAEIDIDSHSPAPFTVDDESFLSKVCKKLSSLF
jgi:L-methionine (R)-S-oxide reductase